MKIGVTRPTNEEELAAVLRHAYDYARKSQYDLALEICDWLIEGKATLVAGYRERAAVKEHMGDLDGAINDLKEVVSRSPIEPADFHAFGLALLQSGMTLKAVEAFSHAISLGEETGVHYYTNSSRLLRADAYLKLNDLEDAIADAKCLPDEYCVHIPGAGLQSKEAIISLAKAALQKRRRPPQHKG